MVTWLQSLSLFVKPQPRKGSYGHRQTPELQGRLVPKNRNPERTSQLYDRIQVPNSMFMSRD